MNNAIILAERLREKNIIKLNKNFYKGRKDKKDFYIQAILLEISCTNNKKKLKEGGSPSKNAKNMLKEIMKKLKVKSVNNPNGKPNFNIDLEFYKNKNYYCERWFS